MNNEQSPFRVGQRVVCVKQHQSGVPIKDKVYVVESIYTCPKCGRHYIDYGVPHGYPQFITKITCPKCSHVEVYPEIKNELIDPSYFAPITESYEDITAYLAAEGMNTYDQPDVIKIKELQN